MLCIPDLPDYAARHQLETEDRLLKVERKLGALRLPEFSKAIPKPFDDKKHPRWPKHQSDGGRFKPAGGSEANENSPVRLVSDTDDSARHGVGGNNGPPLEDPPEIPPEKPPSPKVRNSFLRNAAQWLSKAAGRGAISTKDPKAKLFFTTLKAVAWVAEKYLPNILSSLDAPKDLKDLQDAANGPSVDGYEDHHIVEVQRDSQHEQGNSKLFSQEQLLDRENVVRIPYWKHRAISDFYSQRDDLLGMTPRQYLRGKSWEEQYSYGLEKLRDFGVLKK